MRKPKRLAVIRAKEKSLVNKAPYLVESFTAEKFREKLSPDVSYIKCTDSTLYLSAIKDYFNNEIVSYSISNNNDVNLIIESYKNLNVNNDAIIYTDQGVVYFAYEYAE